MAGKPWVTALRMLAARRLTESQLQSRLARKGFLAEEVALVVERAKNERFIDDHSYAQIYLETTRKPLGDRCLVAELVKRGIARELASAAVADSTRNESDRLAEAYAKLCRVRPGISHPSAAQALARYGFATPRIYSYLRNVVGVDISPS